VDYPAAIWDRWRLAGVFPDKAFSHPLAAGTAALPGRQIDDWEGKHPLKTAFAGGARVFYSPG